MKHKTRPRTPAVTNGVDPDSPLRRAVYRLGGPTKTAIALGVSGSTVHLWLSRHRMPVGSAEAIERVNTMAALSGETIGRLTGLLGLDRPTSPAGS